MTTILLFYPPSEAEVITGILEVWFQESDVSVSNQGTTDKKGQGVIALEFDGDVPAWFPKYIEKTDVLEDYLVMEAA